MMFVIILEMIIHNLSRLIVINVSQITTFF